MPFHIPRHQHTVSDSSPTYDNFYSAANAIYSAGQTLSSVGAPNPHWNSNPPATASENNPYQPQPNLNGNGTVIPYRPAPNAYPGNQTAPSSDSQQRQYHQRLSRSLTVGRQQEGLHLYNQQGTAMSDVHHYGAPPAYGGDALSINIEPSTPGHPNSVASNPIPGTLQPGLQNRPSALNSSNTAPVLPTLPQISTQMQHSPMSVRPMTLNHSHSYSRSSPGAMDQPRYKPFSNTPEQSKYPSAPTGHIPNTPQGPPSYSPLGLADIRPRSDTNATDIPFSPGVVQEEDRPQYPQNSNYNAPWPIYAVDWCKWPPRSNSASAGKIAIGSYLEDNHNYVRQTPGREWTELTVWADSNSRHATDADGPRQPSWRTRAGVCQNCRGNARLSGNTNTLGTTLLEQTDHGPPRNVRRPLEAVVTTERSARISDQLNNALSQREVPSTTEAITTRSSVKLEISRTYRPYHIVGLECGAAVSDHHFFN